MNDGKKAALSLFLSFMVLMVMVEDAQAAALSWDDIKGALSSAKDKLISAGKKIVATVGGGLAGALVGGVLAGALGVATGGLGTLLILGGTIIGSWIGNKIGNWWAGDTTTVATGDDGKTPTDEEFIEDADIKQIFGEYYQDAQEAALADIQALKQNLLGSLTDYSYNIKGGEIGSFSVKLKGPSVIYGYSAFPVVLELKYHENPDLPDPVHITKVSLYVKEDATGYIYYKWSWSGDVVLENTTTETDFKTIFKAPDPLISDVNKLLSGSFDKATIEKLYTTPVPKFEIYAEVSGYKELWKYENGQWKQYGTEPFSFTISSLSAYNHISDHEPAYELGGAIGTLPTKFKVFRVFTPYSTKVAGSINNIIVRAWSNPVHYVGSSVDYAFYFIALRDYFEPLSPTIIDDYRLAVIKDLGGTWALADTVTGNLGDMSNLNAWAGTVVYHKDENAIGYNVFMVVKADLQRDDGVTIPLWVIAKPTVAVLPDEETILVDQNITQILPLVNKTGEFTAEDIETLRAWAAGIIEGLNNKIAEAKAWIDKTDNEEAKDLFNEAIRHYEEAIAYLEKLGSVTDPETAKRYIKIAKNEEIIGDYYKEAGVKMHYGDVDQAAALIQNAEAIEEETQDYKGSLLGSISSAFESLPDWVLVLLVALLVFGLFKWLFGD